MTQTRSAARHHGSPCKRAGHTLRTADGCVECRRLKAREPVAKAKRRNRCLLRSFGITLADYNEILKKQGGCCAICGTGTPGGHGSFHVDHAHDEEDGGVRGLLCARCNTGLGFFRDSPELLSVAVAYLLADNNK